MIGEDCRKSSLFVSLQISAQESRRKKKEFVDTLERQVEVATQELDEYKKRCQGLEKENRYINIAFARQRHGIAT